MFPFMIKSDAYQQMLTYCQSQIPFEACGILSGINQVVTTTWCLPNAERSPYRYSIALPFINQTFSSIKQKGEQFLGIFHSHPTAPPDPSPEDIRNANYPEATYVIVSLLTYPPQTGCFQILHQQAFKKQLIIVP